MATISRSGSPGTIRRSNRNQSIEICKLFASFLVVFAHIPFPGLIGKAADCLAKITVAFFFAVTGYFNYQVTDTAKIKLRILHIVKLNIIASFAEILWKVLETEYHGGSTIVYLKSIIPSAFDIRQLLILNINPYRVHLWYLFAILEIYVLLYLYVCFWGKQKPNYRPLYIISSCLLAINIVFSVYGLSVDFIVNPWLFYNAIFYGLPMFSIGVFIHEYQDRIMENYSLNTFRLICVFLFGTILSVIETMGSSGTYSYVYLGCMIEMTALLLLCLRYPQIAGPSKTADFIISRLGLYSTTVYIVHYIMLDVYSLLFMPYFVGYSETLEGYLRPIIIVTMSLMTAVVCDLVLHIAKRSGKKTRC